VDPPTPEEGLRLPLTAPHDRDLLARAKVHPSIAQKILRHANIETTLAIYTHVDDIEDMRSAVAKLDFGPLEESAPAAVVPLRKQATFATSRLFPKKMRPLTVSRTGRRSGASLGRGDWV